MQGNINIPIDKNDINHNNYLNLYKQHLSEGFIYLVKRNDYKVFEPKKSEINFSIDIQ